jgi:copper homeostasis protein
LNLNLRYRVFAMDTNFAERVLLEICVTSVEFAIAAECGGADRIELCSELECGGVTADGRLMEAARAGVRIPIHVLIRPRAGRFVYSGRELWTMRRSIEKAKELKMDGIVVGVLDAESRVDVARTRELVEAARPLPVTFHRAFDLTGCGPHSVEAVMEAGASRLLTSGGRRTAREGLSTLARLVKDGGERLRVMPGGGITPGNVVRVVRATGAREVHGSLLTRGLREAEWGAGRRALADRYCRRVRKVAARLRAEATV